MIKSAGFRPAPHFILFTQRREERHSRTTTQPPAVFRSCSLTSAIQHLPIAPLSSRNVLSKDSRSGNTAYRKDVRKLTVFLNAVYPQQFQ